MSQFLAAVPRRVRSRPPLVVLLALGVGMAALRGGDRPRSARPGPVEAVACALEPEPARPRVPAHLLPRLEACLARWRSDTRPGTAGEGLRRANVTVADIVRWIEVEGDPAWMGSGAWWVPLSDEGDPEMPSGLYGDVPLDGPLGINCGQSIIN